MSLQTWLNLACSQAVVMQAQVEVFQVAHMHERTVLPVYVLGRCSGRRWLPTVGT